MSIADEGVEVRQTLVLRGQTHYGFTGAENPSGTSRVMNLEHVTASSDVLPLSPAISSTIVNPNIFDPVTHLPLFAAAGFSCMELSCNAAEKDFDVSSRTAMKELVSVSTDLGIRIHSVHAPGVYPRTYVDKEMGKKCLDATKAHCDIAAELGAGVVILHRLKTGKPGPPQWDRIMHEVLAEMAEYALTLPLVIGLENLNWRVVPREDLDIVRSYSKDAMGFVLDTGHAHMFGAIDEYLASCDQRLCSLHLHDNDATRDFHWLPGRGSVNWEMFMRGLAETGYTGPLMAEVQDPARQGALPDLLDECMSSLKVLQGYLPGSPGS